jgi:hypothetical protein
MVLCWTAALAADGPNSPISDDVALTKATIALLAKKDFGAVRDRFDPAMGQISDDTLRQMSDAVAASDPVSVETISATGGHNASTGDGYSRIVLEYGFTGKWGCRGRRGEN